MLQEHLGNEYEITNISKPNAPLADVDEYLKKFGNDLIMRYHIIIVGGPRNSLDRNYHYSIQRTSTSMQRSNNTNVRFVHLFWRHDKYWINRKVWNVNLRIDQVVLGCGKSHTHVTETTSFQREDCHLNSQVKKKLTLLTAKNLGDKNLSHTCSNPVTTSQRASPFLA
jgi:hypothetical protein